MCPLRRLVPRAEFWVAALVLGLSSAARAQDTFEIQVYQPDVNPLGIVTIQLHLNYTPIGLPPPEAGRVGTNHAFHATLEPGVGLGHDWELGGYLLSSDSPARGFEFAGTKVRVKKRFPLSAAWDIALNFELAYSPAQFDVQWTGEIRPIIEYRVGHWHFDLNTNLSFDWVGPDAGLPQIEPCASAEYALTTRFSVGLEYYTALGPITRVAPLAREYHATFAITDIEITPALGVHAGIGAGLTPVSSPLVAKAILSAQF